MTLDLRRSLVLAASVLLPALPLAGQAARQSTGAPAGPAGDAVAARSPAPLTPSALAALDSLAAAEFARDSVGSYTVGVVEGDSLVWTKSYGWADVARTRPATRASVYRIGSITKPFTAVMLLQLVERGRVSLADPVSHWVPEISRLGGLPAGAAPPTLVQLATMTAGLAREPRREGPFWTGPVSRWDSILVSALPHTVYDFAPGSRYQYSNIGYAILGLALERAAGVPYVAWEREHVLAPLGMRRTRFEVDPSIASDVAAGHQIERSGQVDDTISAHEAKFGRGYKVPNGAMFTTVDDLARFVGFELGHGPAGVLKEATRDSAFGGLVASSGTLGSGYGVGFMAQRLAGGRVAFGHGGSVAGYTAAILYDRQADVGVVVLRSAGGGKGSVGRLAPAMLERLEPRR